MYPCGFAARVRGPTSCPEGIGLDAPWDLHAAASFAIAAAKTITATTASAHIGDRGADVEVEPRSGA